MDINLSDNLKAEITSLIPFVSGYSVLCSYLYTQIYWFHFDINPFVFIGVGDLIQQSITVLATTFAFIGVIFIIENTKKQSNDNDRSIEFTNKNPFKLTLFYVSIFLVLISLSYLWSSFVYLAIGCSLPFINYLQHMNALQTHITNKRLRFAFSAIIVALPVYSIANAVMNAHLISNPDKKSVLISFDSIECKTGCIFIGKLGVEFVYKTKEKEIKFINSESLNNFELGTIKN